ncbi:hypothetical protein GCM10027290_05750 [Micromonospora sonneratiae]|uniref:Putative pterin-4-alpha-carbinolamine dehydratase n=1 Tax=Micromonospora sonneratiae TaxID=1184706 RepID=A0ABW3YMS5_9ACTN
MGKQMEGDNKRRRTLARKARNGGQQPSQAGVTLGASKQFEHLDRGQRAGPQPAGTRKPTPDKGGPVPPPQPAPAARPWPIPDSPGSAELSQASPGVPVIRYQELVSDVGRRTGIDFDQARSAAEATVIALALALDEADRERLLDAVPAELHNSMSTTATNRRRDLAGFLEEVARLSHRTPEQARYQAEATINAIAERDRDLVESLDLPMDLRDLVQPLPEGGLVGATGHTAPLTAAQLRAALADLPYWAGDQKSLSRTIELPRENLDRVMRRLELLHEQTGRGPRIGRESDRTAVIVVRTRQVDAVTAMDIELAHQVDAAIDEVGAGMA